MTSTVARLSLEDVKRAAKREDFRAGVQMRLLLSRLGIRFGHDSAPASMRGAYAIRRLRKAPSQFS